MFAPEPRAIVLCYGKFNPEHIPAIERKGWVLNEGVPSDSFLQTIPKPFVLIVDDLMGEIDAKRLA